MKKRTRIVAGAAAAIVATGGAWTASGTSAASPSGQRTWPFSASQSAASAMSAAKASAATSRSRVIAVVEQTVREAQVDVGASGESPGDFFLAEGKLWNTSRTKVVGRDSVRCTLGIQTFICDATAQLFGRGKITVSGAFFSESDSRIPITGGTGAFKQARGQLTVADETETTSLLVFEVAR